MPPDPVLKLAAPVRVTGFAADMGPVVVVTVAPMPGVTPVNVTAPAVPVMLPLPVRLRPMEILRAAVWAVASMVPSRRRSRLTGRLRLLLMVRIAPLCTESVPTVVFVSSVGMKVTPVPGMTTSAPAAGGPAGVQLPGVLQSASELPFHV